MQTHADESAIRAMHAVWIEAVNAGNLERLLELMSDDVVYLGPGHAPFGRDQFPGHYSNAMQQSRIQCSSEIEEIAVVDELAYTVCKDALSVTPRAGGATTKLAGHRLTIYRRAPDGRWLLARDAHTLSPVPD